VPWGKVNYFWGDFNPDHLHIVWQKDEELRRDCVYAMTPGKDEVNEEQKRAALHAAATWKYRRQGINVATLFRFFIKDPEYGIIERTDTNESVRLPKFSFYYSFSDLPANLLCHTNLEFRNYGKDWEQAWSLACQAQQRADTKLLKFQQLQPIWRARYRELEALDELFIAV
jgi:hypothetical protein